MHCLASVARTEDLHRIICKLCIQPYGCHSDRSFHCKPPHICIYTGYYFYIHLSRGILGCEDVIQFWSRVPSEGRWNKLKAQSTSGYCRSGVESLSLTTLVYLVCLVS